MGDIYHYDEETGKAFSLSGSVPIDDTQASEDTVYSSAKVETMKVVVASKTSVSSLPTTISDTKITSDHVLLNSVLSNPSAQTGDWTVTTSAGQAVISGTISGSTDITLYLAPQRT